MDFINKVLLLVLGVIIITLIVAFTLFEDVIPKLDRACNKYGMDYEYRNGENCLDESNVLHPIASDCSIWRWKECNIRFIEHGGAKNV